MILLEDILIIHYLLIEDFGGTHGTRDEHLLQSAIVRPYQTFGGLNFIKLRMKKQPHWEKAL